MARLFIIRHGETTANTEHRYQGHIDTPLNHTGKEQAVLLARTLRHIPFQRMYASPLCRAQETARLLAQHHKKKIITIPELKERHFGLWENLTAPEIRKKYPRIYARWLQTPAAPIPGAESLSAFKKRILQALRNILQDMRTDETIAIVTHGGPNRIMLQHFLGITDSRHFWKIKQDNACINIVDIHPTYHLVSLLNYHSTNLLKASIKY